MIGQLSKEEINRELLVAIKESSIDCSIHTSGENKEGLQCFTFTSGDPDKFAFTPSINDEESDSIGDVNKQEIKYIIKGKSIIIVYQNCNIDLD